MTAQRTLPTERLVVFYALYFMTVGITLPFLPGYLRGLGLTPSQIGLLLAVGPTFALVMPPLWGVLADRTGRPGVVLAVVTTGAAVGYAALFVAGTFRAVLGALALHAAFASSITALIDALTLHELARSGGSYARVRVFGSLGFVVASLAFGLSIDSYGPHTVLAPLTLMSLAGAWAAVMLTRAPPMETSGPRPSLGAALELLKEREVALFLLATGLHWIACTPYHGSLALYVKDLGHGPDVVSWSASLAVGAEIVVMFTWPRWAKALSARRLLVLAFAASSVRWALMAWTSRAAVLAASSLLHGLTFGAFYLAAVAWMAERTPPSLRATGQALFVACTFGLGGLVGYASAGRIYDLVGGGHLFAYAAALELLPVLALLASRRTRVPSPAG